MQSGFVHEDGMGGTFNDQGNHIYVIQMEINDKGDPPLENVTDFDECTHLKLPKRDINYVNEETNKGIDDKDTVMKTIQTFRSYKPSEKKTLFYLVFEKGKRVRAAALELRINPRTAQNWSKKNQEDPQGEIMRRAGS